MRKLRLIVEYDGTAFNGYQRQTGHKRSRTVQAELESAIEKMVHHRVSVRAASRTDAGVHARGQVVVFETERDNIPEHGFLRGLNAYLPDDVSIAQVDVVEPMWNPRRASRGKHYRYLFWNTGAPSALERNFTWFVPEPMDLLRMRAGAAHLLGTHDFESFRAAGCSARHAIRTMYAMTVSRGPHARIQLDVTGNAFVRNMVRIIAGTLKEVATGRLPPERVGLILASRDRTVGGPTAPPQGLCLEEVIYDDRLPERPRDDVDLGESDEEVESDARKEEVESE